jgi:hypothetical protein
MTDVELITFGVFIAFFIAIIKALIQTLVEKWSKKEWKFLTGKEILDCFRIDMTEVEIGRAIEAKLKEKNT